MQIIYSTYMILPSLENFKKLSKQGNLIPIYKKIKINEENPSLLLRKIQEEGNQRNCSKLHKRQW